MGLSLDELVLVWADRRVDPRVFWWELPWVGPWAIARADNSAAPMALPRVALSGGLWV